jgi:hypothetical protein
MHRDNSTDATTRGEDERGNRPGDHHSPQRMNPQTRTDGGTRDERGVSEVLGAILVFGLVLALLALVQISAVPAANQQIEFEHSQRVAGDFQGLDENVERVAETGISRSTRIEAGVRYPPRLFLLNPPPVSGRLQAENSGDIQLQNVRAQDPETRDYWTGDDPQSRPTVSLSYQADYNEFASKPSIRYETGLLYRQFENSESDVVVDPGNIVSGRRISLVALEGSFSTSTESDATINAAPVSAPARTISVTDRSASNPIRITIPTDLSEERWVGEILNDEIDNNGQSTAGLTSCADIQSDEATFDSNNARYVADCTYNNGAITIVMEPGATYDLRMAKVGLGSGFSEEGAAYLTTVSGDETSILTGQTQQLTVEVRDQYNNPVSGVPVTFSPASGSGTVSAPNPVTSDENGRATVTFTPSSTTDSKTVTASILGGGSDELEATFNLEVTSGGGGGGDTTQPDRLQDINPRTEDVYLQSASYVDTNVMNATFRNTASEERVMQTGRIPFVLGIDNPTSAALTNDTGTTNYGTLAASRPLQPLGANGISIPAGATRTVVFTFNEDLEQSATGNFDSLFVFTTEISDPADADRQPYTFFITDGFGQEPFTTVAASDVPRGSAGTTQEFSFTPENGMQAGQTVTIDLDPAQGQSSGAPSPVDYRPPTVSGSSTLQGGSTGFTVSQNGQNAELVYTVGSDDLDPGEQVTIVVEGVKTQSAPTAVLDITFTWSEGGSQSASFGVD